MIKILIVGAWMWPQYEASFAVGLERNGVIVSRFSTMKFFNGLFGRLQLTIPFPGFATLNLNQELIKKVKDIRPDVALFWRPTHIFPGTIAKFKELGIQTVSYNNDDPFGPHIHGNVPWHHNFLWFWYLRSLRIYDKNFFYRIINCEEALSFGAKHSDLLLPYFIPWQDKPIQMSSDDADRYYTDVVFVGHYEPDGREHYIRALIDAGIKVKIWGGGKYWNRKVLQDLYPKLAPIVNANGDNYAKALCGSKICLAFLSKLNRDTYTRRCFEIPACGRVLLAERTDDLMRMFKEDKEACFFSNKDELIAKVKWLMENPTIREQIANDGLRRVNTDGHDVFSRAKYFCEKINITIRY